MDEFWPVLKQILIGFYKRVKGILENTFNKFSPAIIYLGGIKGHRPLFNPPQSSGNPSKCQKPRNIEPGLLFFFIHQKKNCRRPLQIQGKKALFGPV